MWSERWTLMPACGGVALMLLWATHDGGYDQDTWYWGALVVLSVLVVVLPRAIRQGLVLSRASVIALIAFTAFLGWSFLSIAWAQVPGWALEGSNRTLLYVLLFALFLVLPWKAETALVTVVVFAVGVGLIAVQMLLRIESASNLHRLLIDGRLAAPTGYFNSTTALFMTEALMATVLATRRELPGLLRGVLIAFAAASLQLCVMGQSRGWLFTLPVVLVAAAFIARDRLRVAAAAVLPALAVLIPIHRLLNVFQGRSGKDLHDAATSAGRVAILLCVVVLVVGTLIAWAEQLSRPRGLSRTAQRRIGAVVVALSLLLGGAGALAATHGDPAGFVKRQWHGFVHATYGPASSSHFSSVGSGRYDFWRVSVKAFTAHPLGGLGQDNFADFYLSRRHTGEQPRWTHSLEMRLLAHTGIVGLLLMALFLGAALFAARPALRSDSRLIAAAGSVALLPIVPWLVHGSVDWFWEVPALTGPALAFLAMAGSVGTPGKALCVPSGPAGARRSRTIRAVFALAGAAALVAAAVVLGLGFLSVRYISKASDIRQRNPSAALDDLATAAGLNPLNPDAPRLAGLIALESGRLTVAERRFQETISREPRGWLAWLGKGLAASALGDNVTAAHDFQVASSINSLDPVIHQALARVNGLHPMTPGEAIRQLTSSSA